jgi:hypothetical protein
VSILAAAEPQVIEIPVAMRPCGGAADSRQLPLVDFLGKAMTGRELP